MRDKELFPVWEVVVMSFALLSGVRGLTTPPATSGVYSLLGGMAPWFYGALVVSALLSILGTVIRGADGLMMGLGGAVLLTVTCSSVYGGVAFLSSNFLYTGAVAIMIFAVGSLARSIQIVRLLHKVRRALEDAHDC